LSLRRQGVLWSRIDAELGRTANSCSSRYKLLKEPDRIIRDVAFTSWTTEADAELIELAQEYDHSWHVVASKLLGGGKRTPNACQVRYYRLTHDMKRSSSPSSLSSDGIVGTKRREAGSKEMIRWTRERWTAHEDEQLRLAVRKYQSLVNNWNCIARDVGRTAGACRARWLRISGNEGIAGVVPLKQTKTSPSSLTVPDVNSSKKRRRVILDSDDEEEDLAAAVAKQPRKEPPVALVPAAVASATLPGTHSSSSDVASLSFV
jgi:Myb-like DNA-binding domain